MHIFRSAIAKSPIAKTFDTDDINPLAPTVYTSVDDLCFHVSVFGKLCLSRVYFLFSGFLTKEKQKSWF